MADGPTGNMNEVIKVYRSLLEAWNARDAAAYAGLFEPIAHVTGFDGSQMNGREEIESELTGIFAHHSTAAYVAKVRDVVSLAPGVTLLRAAVGMIPPGQQNVNPAANAIQSLVVRRSPVHSDAQIVFFQNTPAALHGRPELVDEMTSELEEVRRSGHLIDHTFDT